MNFLKILFTESSKEGKGGLVSRMLEWGRKKKQEILSRPVIASELHSANRTTQWFGLELMLFSCCSSGTVREQNVHEYST
jgi:hypothetical protein